MTQYIQVAEDEREEPIEIPSEEDGTLLLTTVAAQFPGACGMKYRNPSTGNLRGIRMTDGTLYPPDGVWGHHVYIVVFPKENKRKGDDVLDNPMAKTKCLDNQRCSDLIVLGLPWKSTEEDLKRYFSQLGEIVLAQVKRDPKSGQSKGFGFIRFNDYEAQVKCMSQRHMIDGRWCDVTIPNSNEGAQQLVSRKVFVARCTENITADDLRNYFSKYGEVVDVFIPKPFRAFAFVTFNSAEVARSLVGEDHIIKGTSVFVTTAAPKNSDKYGGGGSYSKGGQGMGSQRGWNQQQQQGAFGNALKQVHPSQDPNNIANSLGMNFFNSAVLAAAQAVLTSQGAIPPPNQAQQAPQPTQQQHQGGGDAYNRNQTYDSSRQNSGTGFFQGWGSSDANSAAGGYASWAGGQQQQQQQQGGWN